MQVSIISRIPTLKLSSKRPLLSCLDDAIVSTCEERMCWEFACVAQGWFSR